MSKRPIDQIPKTFKGMIYKLFFYKTKEVLWFVIIILLGIILAQSVSFGWKNGEFYFNWGKAANIDIEISR